MTYVPIIAGVAIGGYRSYGPTQFVGPLSKVNLVAGPNNCGKSNLLRFVSRHLPLRMIRNTRNQDVDFAPVDRALSGETATIGGTAIGPDHPLFADALTLLHEDERRYLLNIFRSQTLSRGSKHLLWFMHETPSWDGDSREQNIEQAVLSELPMQTVRWNNLAHRLRPTLGPEATLEHLVFVVLQELRPFRQGTFSSVLIEAVRYVHSEKDSYSGGNLVKKLVKLRDPSYDRQEDKKRFAAIQRFLKDVAETATAEIDIPSTQDSLIIHMHGKSLPLSSLGTGIHQVVILAAACSVLENTVVCLEEPELNLHPVYQRKLLKFLYDNTSNQYLIATHSPHLLDAPWGTVFQVSLEATGSVVTLVANSFDRWRLASALGARASDVVQANSAIWVEGPSDRLYLNNWLKQVAPELVEGAHYVILFYGGKVLSHFSADDPEFTELVSLLAANRHTVVVMDRDNPNG
jgi:predicted ATPase